jgi:uncharacterized tellurite resistance protein B-like protein
VDPEQEARLDRTAREALLREIEEYFTGAQPNRPAPKPATSAYRRRLQLATAVLLIEMARADHAEGRDELREVERALTGLLGLAPREAAILIRMAEHTLEQPPPFKAVTRLIADQFTGEEKRKVVQALWQVAFADAELGPHEEYFVRKVADLIHLPFDAFLLAKIRAKEDFFRAD